MTWSAPPTFVTGSILTASQLNIYLRDNTLALRGMPRCRLYMSADQSIGNASLSELLFDVEQIDTHGLHAPGSGHIAIPTGWAGDYLVLGVGDFDGNTSGDRREGEIQVNDLIKIVGSDNNPSAGTGQRATFGMSTLWPGTVVGDYFNLKLYQNTGGALNAKHDGYAGCHLAAYFVGSGVG